MRKKKWYCFLALLSVLTLGACGVSDEQSMLDEESNSPAVVQDSSEREGASGQEESDSAQSHILDGLFQYELIEEENTILLTEYIGEEENLTVYGTYEIGGKEYKTRLRDATYEGGVTYSPFGNKKRILVSIAFIGGVKLNDCSRYFYECENLQSVDLSGLDTSECSDFSGMFMRCRSLHAVDLSTLNMENVSDMNEMFSSCESLTEMDLTMIDTSKVINFGNLFDNCKNMKKINLTGMNTESAEEMYGMFFGCSSLSEIDVSSFDTSNVDSFSGMFAHCSSVESLDLSNFDTSKTHLMTSMFSSCKALKTLNISSFDTSQVRDMASMFSRCSSLTQLDISHFVASESLNYVERMFQECDQLTAVYVNQQFYDRVNSNEIKKNEDIFLDSSITDFTIK